MKKIVSILLVTTMAFSCNGSTGSSRDWRPAPDEVEGGISISDLFNTAWDLDLSYEDDGTLDPAWREWTGNVALELGSPSVGSDKLGATLTFEGGFGLDSDCLDGTLPATWTYDEPSGSLSVDLEYGDGPIPTRFLFSGTLIKSTGQSWSDQAQEYVPDVSLRVEGTWTVVLGSGCSPDDFVAGTQGAFVGKEVEDSSVAVEASETQEAQLVGFVVDYGPGGANVAPVYVAVPKH